MTRKWAVIATVCSVCACFVGACGESDRPSAVLPGLSTSSMVRGLQAVVNLATSDPDSVVNLSACPLGDFEAFVGKAPADVQAIAIPDDPPFAYVYQAEGEPPSVQCGRGDLVVYTGEVPGNHFREDLVAMLPEFVLTFDNERAYRAGTVARYCAEPISPDGEGFCGADWFNHQVWIGVRIHGDARSSAHSEEWLVAILGDVVANVPQLAPSVQIAD